MTPVAGVLSAADDAAAPEFLEKPPPGQDANLADPPFFGLIADDQRQPRAVDLAERRERPQIAVVNAGGATSSRTPGTFCTSSRMIGRANSSGGRARSCSRRRAGRAPNERAKSVFRKSYRMLRGNDARSRVDLPVLRAPQRNAD